MEISNTAQSIKPSLTRKLYNMAAEYDDVIDFTLGDPDYITPEHIRLAGCEAINRGRTKYSANAGLIRLREAISGSIEAETGVAYRPDSEIIVTVGAMEALYLSLLCLINEGDEVIIPAPYWVNYEHMVQMCHGKPVIVPSDESEDFIVSASRIEEKITPRTKAVIINSPNNPSGAVYDRAAVESLCGLAKKYDLVILWDECYKSIVYDGNIITSVLEFPDMKDRAVIVNSFSKKYSMTGWRIGYAAAPSELISAMTRLQENLVACAPLPSQYAALKALETESDCVERMRLGFQRRRDVLMSEISGIELLDCKKPQGTFYALVNIEKVGMSCVDFAYRLLEEEHVAVVPGITYGDCCAGYVRIAYTMDESKIVEGIRRIKNFVYRVRGIR